MFETVNVGTIAVELVSVVFKAPQHPQLRVGRRPCRGPRVDTNNFEENLNELILNCLIMYQRQTRPKSTILSQKMFLKNLTRVAHQKF